jgi:hypothetical protein
MVVNVDKAADRWRRYLSNIFIRSNPCGFGSERDISRFLDEIQDNRPSCCNHGSGDTGDNEAAHCLPSS